MVIPDYQHCIVLQYGLLCRRCKHTCSQNCVMCHSFDKNCGSIELPELRVRVSTREPPVTMNHKAMRFPGTLNDVALRLNINRE